MHELEPCGHARRQLTHAGEEGVPTVENTVVLNGVTGIIPVTVDSALELIASPVSD